MYKTVEYAPIYPTAMNLIMGGYQCIDGYRWLSMVIGGYQWLSNGYQWLWVVINGYGWFLAEGKS